MKFPKFDHKFCSENGGILLCDNIDFEEGWLENVFLQNATMGSCLKLPDLVI